MNKKGRPLKKNAEIKSIMVSANVDIPTKADLDRFAVEDDSSLSRIIRQAIADYIQRRNSKLEAARG